MIFKDLFDKSIQDQKPLSLIKGDSDNDFWFGTLVSYSEEALELKSYNLFGEFDGYLVVPIEDVSSVEYNDDYEDVMNYLISENNFLAHIPDSKIDTLGGNWKYSALACFEGEPIVVSVQESETEQLGFIKNVSLESIEMACIDKLGESIGSVLFMTDNVESICYYTRRTKKAGMLYSWREAKKKK